MPKLKELAEQGHPKAITKLLNGALSSVQGVTAKVAYQDNCLHIRIQLESHQVLKKESAVKFVCRQLIKWQVHSIPLIKIYGCRKGKPKADWIQEIDWLEKIKLDSLSQQQIKEPSQAQQPNSSQHRGNYSGKKAQKTDSQDFLEQIEALTECDEQLQFVNRIIESADISESLRIELNQHIKRIQQRRSDPNLYLAVVGEFSSGKSTFINALLRDDLLKTSALVATATATKLRFGCDLIVEAKFTGARSGKLKTERNAKNITIPWFAGVNGLDTRQLIHVITSTEEVAKEIVDLTICHPASFLSDGIVIIDTPGTNATNVKHGAITRKVVENEADAAIIIIPATTPLSQSLASFLDGALRPFLLRCIFVVTKMDQIRKREQKSLLSNLQSRLQEALGIENPILLPAAPQIVIDDLTEEEEISERLLHWKDEFLELEATIQQHLRRERILSIADNLLRLLSQLLEQLESHLRQQWEQYNTHQVAIQRETIQDLSLFTLEQQQICSQIIKEAVDKTQLKIKACVADSQEVTSLKIRQAIFAAQDWDALNQVVKQYAETIFKSEQKSFQKAVEDNLQLIVSAAQSAESKFDQKFFESYKRLQDLGAKIKGTQRFSDHKISLDSKEALAGMQSHNNELEDQAIGTVMTGGATGAVIGSLLFPGIGTVIGGVAGAYLSRLFSPSLEERKQTVWEQLNPSLNSYFGKAQIQAEEAVQTYARQAMTAIEQRIEHYMAQYQSAVNTMLKEQQEELQRITKLQSKTEIHLQEIERRKKVMVRQQERLAKTFTNKGRNANV